MADEDALYPVGHRFRTEILAHIAATSEHIAGGGCADFAEYTHSCGRVKGMKEALRLLIDAEAAEQKEQES